MIIHSLHAQSTKNEVTVIVQKNYDSDLLDTVLISYKTDLESNNSKYLKMFFSKEKIAKEVFKLSGSIGIFQAIIQGESNGVVSNIYITKGDTISLMINGRGKNTKLYFKGSNGERLQLQSKLDSISLNGLYPYKTTKAESHFPINLKTLYYRFQLVRDEKLSLLEAAKCQMSDQLFSLYKADVDGKYLSNSCGTGLTFLKETDFDNKLIPVIEELLKKSVELPFTEDAMSSSQMLKGLVDRTILLFAYQERRFPVLLETYDMLKKNYSGRLRERLVFYFIKSLPKGAPEDFAKSATDALKILPNEKERNILIDLLKARNAGNVAYNFSLKNVDNRTINLSDFKGKTVLLDFWFTGCPGCLTLGKMLKKDVLPSFENRDDFVYITINIDKDKSTWMKSIKEGIYTNSKFINLNTGDIGYNHPVLSNYKIRAFPTLIVIDKFGKIVSSNVQKLASEISKYIKLAL